MPQRSVRFFGRWEFKVNSLWLWWYCCLVLIAEGYLMYRAVTRCKDYNELSWNTHEKPVSELYAYICLIVISVMCMPFFIITSIFKVGCYSNDGTRLGRDNVLHHLNVESHDGGTKDRVRFVKDIWRHMGPLSQAFHILAAFSLLLPMSMVESQQIKFGFLKPDKMWSSELEVLYGKSEYRLKSHAPDVSANVTDQPYSNNVRPTSTTIESGPVVMSAEFVNYVLALIIYSLRYAAVHWYTNAAFSVSFAFALLLTSLHYVYSYCGMQILYKFEVNEHAIHGVSLLLPHGVTMALHIIACIITFVSPLSIFNYGYCHYVESCRHFLKQYFPTYARYVAKMPVGCHGYVPHIVATVSLVLFVTFRSPIVYDYVNVYRATGFPILLTCIVVDACYMVLWIALWFAFTLKQTWQFRVNPQMDMLHSIQRAATISAITQPPLVTSQHAPETETSFRDGDSNNNSRDGAGVPQHNTVQVVDRPPPYTSAETVHNHGAEAVRPQPKPKKHLPLLHIDTSEARIARVDQSPSRQYSPNRHNSPHKHSPVRHISPQIHDSPLRQQSPQRQQSPPRHESPTRDHSPARRSSPERHINIRQQSPNRQFSYPSTTDSNGPDTPGSVDTPNTPISPTSALKKSGLRKSGERRHNVHQRVTFDDSVDHIGDVKNAPVNNDMPIDTGQLSPNALRQRKVKSPPQDSSIKYSIPLQTLDILPVAGSHRIAFTGSTPDNTLTRNYRSSIRDKCGQYYKNLGDLGIPPAAQSSPIPYQQRPLSDNYDNRELLLSPLAMMDQHGIQIPAPYSMQPQPHQRNTSEIELTGYYENARSRDPKRRSGRKVHDDDRHSYPPQITQSPVRPPIPNKSYLNNNGHVNPRPISPPRSQTRTHNPMLYDAARDLSIQTRDNQKLTRGVSRDIARDLNKQFLPINKPYPVSMYPDHRPELNRDITIIKPELNRRDSALPSSNETSSNDSAENVLCSQV